IKISYRDENGKEHVKDFRGFSAIVIQHELDHLDGVLFTKHVMAQGEQLYLSYKNEKGEDEFEEIKV
ncbi:MAG: Peptide deformylase, partial [Candidatus Levybacteria bacterium GW2011_GWB1_39_7]